MRAAVINVMSHNSVTSKNAFKPHRLRNFLIWMLALVIVGCGGYAGASYYFKKSAASTGQAAIEALISQGTFAALAPHVTDDFLGFGQTPANYSESSQKLTALKDSNVQMLVDESTGFAQSRRQVYYLTPKYPATQGDYSFTISVDLRREGYTYKVANIVTDYGREPFFDQAN